MVVAVLGVLLLAGAVALFVVLSNQRLPSYGPSMLPTLSGSEALDLDTDAYDERDPRIGEIVVVQGPEGFDRSACEAPHPSASPCPRTGEGFARIRLVKRIVAAPGDTIAFDRNGHAIRNGVRAREPFIRPCRGTCALPVAVTVPDGRYFVAGDNRRNSTDSRIWGAVTRAAIDGRVLLDEG